MAYETLTGGLELVLPTNGTTNWGTIVRNSTWIKINGHQHTGSGDGNQLTGASFATNSLTGLQLSKNLNLTEAPIVVVAAGVNTALVNWNNGNKASINASAADSTVTVTLSNPLAGASYRVTLLQGASPQICTWPASATWPGGEEPTQFMDANSKAIINFDYDGTNHIGSWELDLI